MLILGSLPSSSTFSPLHFQSIVGICVHITSVANRDDSNDNGICDGDGNGIGNCDHHTRSTETSRFAMSTSASMLPLSLILQLANASTDQVPSIRQKIPQPQSFPSAKILRWKTLLPWNQLLHARSRALLR